MSVTIKLTVDTEAEVVKVALVDARGKPVDPGGAGISLTSMHPLIVRLELLPEHPPQAKIIPCSSGEATVRAHADGLLDGEGEPVGVDEATVAVAVSVAAEPGGRLTARPGEAEDPMARYAEMIQRARAAGEDGQ